MRAHNPRHGQPFHRADGEEQEQNIAPEYHHQKHDKNHKGQGIEDIDQAHHHGIDPATHIARHGAPGDANDQCHSGGDKPNRKRDTPAVHDLRQDIAAKDIGAQPVRG